MLTWWCVTSSASCKVNCVIDLVRVTYNWKMPFIYNLMTMDILYRIYCILDYFFRYNRRRANKLHWIFGLCHESQYGWLMLVRNILLKRHNTLANIFGTTLLMPYIQVNLWNWFEYLTPADGNHYSDVIIRAMAHEITGISIVYSAVCSEADQRKHQSSTSLAFVRGIHRWPVNSPYKVQWRGKCFHLMASSCYCCLIFKWVAKVWLYDSWPKQLHRPDCLGQQEIKLEQDFECQVPGRTIWKLAKSFSNF